MSGGEIFRYFGIKQLFYGGTQWWWFDFAEKRQASEAACFIYQRTAIIKSIADLELNFQEQYNVHFKTRLKNIEKNIRALSAALASSEALGGNSFFKNK